MSDHHVLRIFLLYLGRGLHSLSYTSTHLLLHMAAGNLLKTRRRTKQGRRKGSLKTAILYSSPESLAGKNNTAGKTKDQSLRPKVWNAPLEFWITSHICLNVFSPSPLLYVLPTLPLLCVFTEHPAPFFSAQKVFHENLACLSLPIFLRESIHTGTAVCL